MLRKTIFAYAAAAAICFATSAAFTVASADPTPGTSKTRPATGANTLVGANGGGSNQCLEAECGGDEVPIDDNYIVRGCNMTPGDSELPPWCESSTGGNKKVTLQK